MDKNKKQNIVERNLWNTPSRAYKSEDDPIDCGLWLDGFFWQPNEEDIDTRHIRFPHYYQPDKSAIVVAKQ